MNSTASPRIPAAAPLDDSGGGLRPAVLGSALFVVFCGLLYPAVATLLGGLLFPHQAGGSLIERDGRIVGSSLVAQPFADARYFQPRPSAANFDPKALSGSNLASSNPALRERMARDSAAVAAREGVPAKAIPAELISASGSGIDPHLSPQGAQVQVARVAQARGLPTEAVAALVRSHTQRRTLGVLGEPRVNVLALNLALDAQGARP
ncbi:potassium-transporting ATPase subunit KdpC [Tahibacter harae]|uniref:Potassium-transporting ATPase KdpC subunit n=1 Tax=Tahibacter harae TaxID=2963937 RepID=A0ABT1QMY3_9GAMM|nr:potassium-transporting ATPase subunit KdpC [Tahibacter harae]MCQ4163883.1 potassium-transporting ATPase subunit KdpC [Tahibacter harae]